MITIETHIDERNEWVDEMADMKAGETMLVDDYHIIEVHDDCILIKNVADTNVIKYDNIDAAIKYFLF